MYFALYKVFYYIFRSYARAFPIYNSDPPPQVALVWKEVFLKPNIYYFTPSSIWQTLLTIYNKNKNPSKAFFKFCRQIFQYMKEIKYSDVDVEVYYNIFSF